MFALMKALQMQYWFYNCMCIVYAINTSQIKFSLKICLQLDITFNLAFCFCLLPTCYHLHIQQV